MMNRRTALLNSASAAVALISQAGPGVAQDRQPAALHVFVPAGAGGGWDGAGRAFAQVARDAGLVGATTIENVAGAGGTVGLPRFINRFSRRGNAVMVAGNVMIGAVLANKSPLGLTDVQPIARLTQEAGVIVVSASSSLRTIDDLIALLKTNPALPIGGGSAGGIDHITLGLLLKSVRADVTRANYVAFPAKAQAVPAILEDQVRAAISGYSEYSEQIKAGQMRALATTGMRRLPEANVPTLKEAGIDVVTASWRALFAAPEISRDDHEKLVELARKVHALPAWQKLLVDRQWDDAFLVGDVFKDFVKSEIVTTSMILKDLGLT